MCFEAYAGRRYELRTVTQGRAGSEETGGEQGSYDVARVILIEVNTQEVIAYSGEPIDAERSEPPAPQPVIRVVPGLL